MKNSLRTLAGMALMSTFIACQPAPPVGTPPIPTPTPTPVVSPTPTPTPIPTPTPEATPVPGQERQFAAILTGSQEVPAVGTAAYGTARISLDKENNTVEVSIVTSGLSGPITAAHIHVGNAGQNGSAVKPLDIRGNIVTGTWRLNDTVSPLTETTLNQLLNGELYVNVHTHANPNGEIRGQITATQDELFPVYLSGDQEVPGVSGGAMAAALVRISPNQNEVRVEGYASQLSSEIIGAHIHKGAKGVNGDVVKPLIVNSNQFSVTWKRTDATNPLTTELLSDLRAGNLYLNLHTPTHPDGEVRGQAMASAPLTVAADSTFVTELMGVNEVPAVLTNAYGVAELKLNGDRNEISVEVTTSGLSGPITGAHIHKGPMGSNGAIVKPLNINGNRLSASWKMSDNPNPLTLTLLNDLLTGNLYLNAHTAANPGGEIRGQLMSSQDKVYTLLLEGDQEVPAVNTAAKGAAWVMISPDHSQVTIKGYANGLSGAITGGHIHAGPMGLSGPVLKPLTIAGNMYQLTWTTLDPVEPLTEEKVKKLMNGEYYLNLHTAVNPNGEIRAQIVD